MLNLDDLARWQKHICLNMLGQHGTFAPVIIAFVERDGEPATIAPLVLDMPHGWDQRDMLAELCRKALADLSADGYVFCSEIWLSPPMTPEELARRNEEGWSGENRPANDPRRLEGVVIHVENKRRERHTELWIIQRDPGGKFKTLVSAKDYDLEAEQFAGRFCGLLDPRTVN